MEEVTRGAPASCMASLQWEPSQRAHMYWSDGKEREVEQLEHREEMELETQGGEGKLVIVQSRNLGPW